MLPVVVAFSGRIGSGKTTVSAAVAGELRCPHASFGDYVRRQARERGLDHTSRNVLQEVGESLIKGGWEPFCQSVIDSVGWAPHTSIVIDGIRHEEAITTLKRIVQPLEVFWVYIDVSDITRTARLSSRYSSHEIRQIDEHSTEEQVTNILKERADLVINGSLDLGVLTNTVLEHIGLRRPALNPVTN